MSHARKLSSQMLAERVRQFLDTKLSDIPGLEALRKDDDAANNFLFMGLNYTPYSAFDLDEMYPDTSQVIPPGYRHDAEKPPSEVTVENYLYAQLAEYNIPVASREDLKAWRDATGTKTASEAVEAYCDVTDPQDYDAVVKLLNALDALAAMEKTNAVSAAQKAGLKYLSDNFRQEAQYHIDLAKTEKAAAQNATAIEEQNIKDIVSEILVDTKRTTTKPSSLPEYITDEIYQGLLSQKRSIPRDDYSPDAMAKRKRLCEKVTDIVKANQIQIDYKRISDTKKQQSQEADKIALFNTHIADTLNDICTDAGIKTGRGNGRGA